MREFPNLESLCNSIPQLSKEEWVYCNIDKWNESPKNTEFYYITEEHIQNLKDSEIYYDNEDLEMPKSVENKNIKAWMLVGNLNHIISNSKSENDIINGVNHYREYDDFN